MLSKNLRIWQRTLSYPYDGEVKKENYHRIERYFGTFQRSFSLPATIEQENVAAICEKGVLTITLPKKEKIKPKQIHVTVKQA
jgi:HSP20 family protein